MVGFAFGELFDNPGFPFLFVLTLLSLDREEPLDTHLRAPFELIFGGAFTTDKALEALFGGEPFLVIFAIDFGEDSDAFG